MGGRVVIHVKGSRCRGLVLFPLLHEDLCWFSIKDLLAFVAWFQLQHQGNLTCGLVAFASETLLYKVWRCFCISFFFAQDLALL